MVWTPVGATTTVVPSRAAPSLPKCSSKMLPSSCAQKRASAEPSQVPLRLNGLLVLPTSEVVAGPTARLVDETCTGATACTYCVAVQRGQATRSSEPVQARTGLLSGS